MYPRWIHKKIETLAAVPRGYAACPLWPSEMLSRVWVPALIQPTHQPWQLGLSPEGSSTVFFTCCKNLRVPLLEDWPFLFHSSGFGVPNFNLSLATQVPVTLWLWKRICSADGQLRKFSWLGSWGGSVDWQLRRFSWLVVEAVQLIGSWGRGSPGWLTPLLATVHWKGLFVEPTVL